MKYAIGDKLVFPVHGAGVVASIEEKEVQGEIVSFYNVEFPYGDLKLLVPANNIEALGVRDIMPASQVPNLIEFIRTADCEGMNQNWNKRQRENLEKIRSGNIKEVAVIYKFLMLRNLNRTLSTGEKKMMTNAKHFLFSEMSLATGKPQAEYEALVKEIITSSKR